MSVFSWVARHGKAVQFGSLSAALVLLVGGMWLGMSQAAGSGAPPPPAACDDCPREAPAIPTKHYVIGTVADVLSPTRAILRTNAGRFVVVESDSSTVVHKKANVAGLRRGTRVIILGTPKDGHFVAEIVTITGQAPARTQPQPAPPTTQQPAAPPGAPVPAPARKPLATPAPARIVPAVRRATPTREQQPRQEVPAAPISPSQTFVATRSATTPTTAVATATAASQRASPTSSATSSAIRAPSPSALHTARPAATASPGEPRRRLQKTAPLRRPEPSGVAQPPAPQTLDGLHTRP